MNFFCVVAALLVAALAFQRDAADGAMVEVGALIPVASLSDDIPTYCDSYNITEEACDCHECNCETCWEGSCRWVCLLSFLSLHLRHLKISFLVPPPTARISEAGFPATFGRNSSTWRNARAVPSKTALAKSPLVVLDASPMKSPRA